MSAVKRLLCLVGLHQWGKWATYKWTGYLVCATPLVNPNGKGMISQVRQKRTCATCGFTQDKLVKNG